MWIEENICIDPFDFVSCNEQICLANKEEHSIRRLALNKKMRGFAENYLMTARDYAEFGAYEEAIEMLGECKQEYPLLLYYKAYYLHKLKKGENQEIQELLEKAEKTISDYCFPNKLEDIAVLSFAIRQGCLARATYYLGNLYYDKLQWKESIRLWEISAEADENFPTVWRNLALAYYNKQKDAQLAKKAMEKAFMLDCTDSRIFLELDQLYKKLGWTFEERLENYELHKEIIKDRDDLYIEYITLVNMCGDNEKAYQCIMEHHFHPWEGGEGKITTQYTLALLGMAQKHFGIIIFQNQSNF